MEIFKGKKLSLIRLFGACLTLISLLSSLFLDFFVLSHWILFSILLVYILPWLALSLLLKFEISFLRNNLFKISIILGINSIIMAIFGTLISYSGILLFLVTIISNFLLLICWHYSPSIYKRDKILSVVGGITYIIFYILFKYAILVYLFGFLTSLLPILLVSLGFLLILSTELIMRRKGLLNYV